MMKMMKSRGSHRFLLSYKSWSERRGSVHKTFHVSCVIQKKLTFYLLFYLLDYPVSWICYYLQIWRLLSLMSLMELFLRKLVVDKIH